MGCMDGWMDGSVGWQDWRVHVCMRLCCIIVVGYDIKLPKLSLDCIFIFGFA